MLLLSAAMTTDEKAIMDYLKSWPTSYMSGREIARKVGGKKRYEDDRGWAIPSLLQLVRLGLIEPDLYGGFRLKKADKKKRGSMHVSPQVLEILQRSGRKFEGIAIDEEGEQPTAASSDPATTSA
jgi:hypothetical protein